MKLQRFFLLLTLVTTVAIAGWLLLAGRIGDITELEAESLIAGALDLPVRIDDLQIALLPLRVEARRVVAGADGEAARADGIRLQLRAIESLRRLRPVLTVAVADLDVDLRVWGGGGSAPDGAGSAGEAGPGTLPRLIPLSVELSIGNLAGRYGERERMGLAGLRGRLKVGPTVGVEIGVAAVALFGERDERRVDLDSLEGTVRWRRGQWEIEHLEARGPDLTLAVEADAEERRRRNVTLRGEIAALTALLADEWQGRGSARLTAALRGDLMDPQVDAVVELEKSTVGAFALKRLDASVERRDGRVTVSSARIDTGAAVLEVSGHVVENDTNSFAAAVGGRDVNLGSVLPDLLSVVPESLRVSGTVEVEGALRPVSIRASGNGSLDGEDLLPVDWSVSATQVEDATALHLDVTQAEHNTLSVDLTALSEQLKGDLRGRFADVGMVSAYFSSLAQAGLQPLGGALNFDAALTGAISDPVLEAQVSGSELLVGEVPIRRLEARLSVDSDQVGIHTDELLLNRGAASFSGTFAIGPEGMTEWSTKLDGVDIAWLSNVLEVAVDVSLEPLEGVVFGQARGDEDDLDAEARAEDGRVGDEPFNKLVVDIDWDGRSWDINGQFSGAVGEQLDARVRIGEDGELEIRADTVEWRLENLSRPAALGLGGRSALHARLNGPAGKLRGDVELVVDDLRVGGIETGAAKLRAEATDGAWAIAGGALNGNLELTGDIDASGELPFSLQASWREIDLAAMLGAEPDLLARASGSLSVEGALRRPQEIVGEMQLASLRIGSGDEVFETEAPIVVRLRNAEVSVDTFALQSRYARLDGDGRIDFDGRLEASLAGDLALEWLELWIGDPIDSAHGEIEFDVDVRRSPDGVLDLAGKARIEEGAVDIAGEISATGLKGSFSFVDDSVEVHGLSGELSGGAFSVAGTIDQRTGPALTWEVVEVGLTPVRSMEVELSGIGELKGAWDAVLLSGDVRILQLLYDRDLEFADLIPSFDRALAPADRATEERRPPLGLDLRFRARDSILIDNSLARLEAAADIRVGGTARAPQLNGQIHIADGAIFLRGRTFEVTSGSLTFRPTLGNVAAIDFSAESVIDTADESYAVSVRVSGYSDNFRVLLASDDGSLSSTDIASLITFGKTVTQLQQSEGSDEGGAVAGLVNFATDRVAGVLAGEAEYALPIDRVEFRPEYSPVTGQFEPQVRFGKYLTDDLSAWLGQSFGVEARTTVEADYRLSRRLSTFLSWESETTNESGAFGGGFRNRIDFWSLPRFFFFGRSEAVEKEGPG